MITNSVKQLQANNAISSYNLLVSHIHVNDYLECVWQRCDLPSGRSGLHLSLGDVAYIRLARSALTHSLSQ